MYRLCLYRKRPITTTAMITPRGTPRPMPILADELKPDDVDVEADSDEGLVVLVARAGEGVVVSVGNAVGV